MAISIAIPSLSGGGAEKVTLLLIQELIRAGNVSKVYVGRQCEESLALDCEVVQLRGYRASESILNFIKAVRRDPADTYLLTLGYVNFAAALRLLHPRANIVLRIGNTIGPEIAALSPFARFRYMTSLRLSIEAATQIVTQCTYMADDLKLHFRGSEDKIRVIYNPIEPHLASWATDGTSPVEGPYIFVAASFKPQKDFGTLLAGFAGSRNSRKRRLVVAGVPPTDTAFRDLMALYGLNESQVLCLGSCKNVYDYVLNAELCVLSSIYEGFSNFLLEGAALGKRIIATDSPGGNMELFNHYQNATTFPVGDYKRLAELLELPRCDLPRQEALSSLVPFSFDTFKDKFESVLRI